MANAFEQEVQRSASALTLHYLKIPIAHKLCRQGAKVFLLPLAENPYDAFLVGQGAHIALELKSQQEFGAFALDRVKPHQREGLQASLTHGGRAYLLLNMRRETVRRAKPRAGITEVVTRSHNRAWAFDFGYWPVLEQLLGERKSIPVELFDQPTLFRPLPRIPAPPGSKGDGPIWDLRVLIG